MRFLIHAPRGVLVVGIALLLAACGGAGQISADTAAQTARTQVPGSDVSVVSTRLSTFGAEVRGSDVASPGTRVWVIQLRGHFSPPSCGPYTATPHPCPSGPATAQVLIDAATGAFIMASLPDPQASTGP